MMWKVTTLELLCLCAFISTYVPGAMAQIISHQEAKNIIYELSDTRWGGRPTSVQTAKMFLSWLKMYRGEAAMCTQRFTYRVEGKKKHGANIILTKGEKNTQLLCIMAHYDHLGMGAYRSREINRNCLHPGADDNASGVALAIMLFDTLQKILPHYTITAVFTAGHEDGLHGSMALVKYIYKKYNALTWLFNLDMVGRLDTVSKILRIETNISWPAIQTDKITPHPQPLHSIGDHTAFVKRNVQIAFVTTGNHDDYHRCSDTPDKINYEGIEFIRQYLTAVLEKLCVTQSGK
ncbi:MAG: M28 family peptidase [Chitinophagales bacterium]|nr:M28 family peptidase [Chitinophagales bacterium]MDW8419110.1 M28 family peptidase [Chitinophagales bacterium]